MESIEKKKAEEKIAIIIGAGPAGLTTAFELLTKTDIKPIIFEQSGEIGGISKTINFNGNRIDIGPHRFFSKSDTIIKWWLNILPLQETSAINDSEYNENLEMYKKNTILDPGNNDQILFILKRITRIFFLRKFFDYPISLNLTTLTNLGFIRTIKIIFSYFKSRFLPIRKEKSLEDFFINRFGRELYQIFFKDYTEKVWGIPCDKIKPEWGAQRVKGLSIMKAILHAAKSLVTTNLSITQKNIETSLIEQFMYPKLGAGQLWEEVAKKIELLGGKIYLHHKVFFLNKQNGKIADIQVKDEITGQIISIKADYFISSMPVRDLIATFNHDVPSKVQQIAQGLIYRDLVLVNLILKRIKLLKNDKKKKVNNFIPDNWIYIQERDVKVGRLTIYNNFSPYMIRDKNTVSIGLEYFCNEGDGFWSKSNQEIIEFAIEEASKIEIIEKADVIESHIIRVPKAYPAYFGTYDQFDMVRNYTDEIENLFLIGRNGMHRYNNQDHSMLTAMTAVNNIINNARTKENIWNINTEKEYHEQKQN